MTPEASMQRRVAQVIEEYDSQGWHRTGTQVDHASALWLADQVRRVSLEPSLEAFAIDRVEVSAAYVEVDGRRQEGLPLFDGAFTTDDGIAGRLGALGSAAEIGIVDASGTDAASDLEQARKEGRHRAIVLVTMGGRPGLAVRNASSFTSPFGPPVLQVSSEASAWLQESVARQAQSLLVASATRRPAETYNVTARLTGINPGLSPLVVTTPRTGWWHCAGERGGGLACWLEAIRALRDLPSQREVWFSAFGAHELGFLGIHPFLEQRQGLVERCGLWLHFGANIGAAVDYHPRVSVPDEGIKARLESAFQAADLSKIEFLPIGAVAGGESQIVHQRGGRCIGIAGSFGLFHMIEDRWPEAVDTNAVVNFAKAFTDLLVSHVAS